VQHDQLRLKGHLVRLLATNKGTGVQGQIALPPLALLYPTLPTPPNKPKKNLCASVPLWFNKNRLCDLCASVVQKEIRLPTTRNSVLCTL
jgi:hypothetical protein